MTAKEAAKILKNEYTDLSIVECFEFSDFYAFGMAKKGAEHELTAGGCFTISKSDGKIGAINPVLDYEVFSKGEPLDISILD